jgi:hypothetical protein
LCKKQSLLTHLKADMDLCPMVGIYLILSVGKMSVGLMVFDKKTWNRWVNSKS